MRLDAHRLGGGLGGERFPRSRESSVRGSSRHAELSRGSTQGHAVAEETE
jgi:hypothetical protein